MKRIKLLSLIALFTLSAQAQLANGFYRVQNESTKRYITVIDGYGKVNVETTDADMNALQTVMGFDEVEGNPASVIYIKKINGGYDMQAQGVGSYNMVGYALQMVDFGDGTYGAYAETGGMRKDLGDVSPSWMRTDEQNKYATVVTNSNNIFWWVKPITSDSEDNYFGVKPTVQVGDKYYTTFVASFPFTFASEGMKAYTIETMNEGKAMAIYKELNGTIEPGTPVIIECSSNEPKNNKLKISGVPAYGTKPLTSEGNLLEGVYFCHYEDLATTSPHFDAVAYNSSSMRVLGKAADGSLAFVKDRSLKYIPANTAYITVSSSAPDVLKVSDKDTPAIPGDLSGDGTVDVDDVAIIAKMILGKTNPDLSADLNHDGVVDVEDFAIIVRITLNL